MISLGKVETFLKKCFYYVFAIFPLFIALCLGGKHFGFGTYEELNGSDTLYNWPIPCALFFVICLFAVFVIYKKGWNRKLFHTMNHKKLALVILAAALVIRVVLFAVFESVLVPYSDGNHVWSVAHTNNETYLNLKATQNGWNNFMGLVVFLVRTFNISYPVFVFVQFIADGFIAFAVFKLAYEIFKSEDAAFWAGLFYAVNPVALMRMFYFSPECYSLLCLTFAACTFVKFMNSEVNRDQYKYALITGLLLGVGNSLKSISIIFLIAAFIVAVLKIMSGAVDKKQIASGIVAVVLIVVPAFGVNKVALKATSATIGVEARDLLMWHQLNVGLNPYGRGNTEENNAWYYSHLIQAGTDPDVAKDMLIEKLKADWKEREVNPAAWLWDKVKYAWTESFTEFTKLMQNSISSEHNFVQHIAFVVLLNLATSVMQLSYIFMILLSIIGVLYIAAKNINSYGAMLISLYVFGFSLLMLIIECQPRYKANIISFLGIIAAYGMVELMKTLSKSRKSYTNESATV